MKRSFFSSSRSRSSKRKRRIPSISLPLAPPPRPQAPSRTSKPVGLTHEDRLKLPTGLHEQTAEELDRNRLGGGFRSFDHILNGGGADLDFWVKKREDSNGGTGNESESESGRKQKPQTNHWAVF
ncbi:hypothetical protein TIFTF001_021900 [Ficus carica]|uniref:Uncharacterized protein n=1 Tax=Ficus carica TaxID=3494 RepID=A0AA88DE08_FICCA|nr:hypothetical protein TIFTF001_021900 [Ficus carica]